MKPNQFLSMGKHENRTTQIMFKIEPSQKKAWEEWLEKVGVKEQERSSFYRGAIEHAIKCSLEVEESK